jgi:hypoxanthine phosphoribosyltransferase
MKNHDINWNEFDRMCNMIAFDVLKSGWKPDYIVGINSGGLAASVVISNILEVPMHPLTVRSFNSVVQDYEHNCWMPEDAIGYGNMGCLEEKPKNILIINDINNSGSIFDWIKKDWISSCLPNADLWNNVWHENVRFAVIVNNLASTHDVDYHAMEVNKTEEPVWINFPWEKQ